MTGSSIFRERVSENWAQIKFAPPGVKVGSILEYRYTLTSSNLFSPPTWYFQSDIPTLVSDIQVNLAKDLEYTFYYKGHSGPKLQQKGTGHWRMQKLPALRKEAFVTTLNDHRQQIGFQLSAYVDRTGQLKKVLQSWEGFSQELLNESRLGKKLRKDKALTEQATLLRRPGESQEQTVNRIFQTVRDRMTYNDKQRIFADEKLSTAWENKSGSSAEINLILVYLLREMEIESHPMLISTRSHGSVMDLHPMLRQFNQLLCYARIGEQEWMLNAVNPLRSYQLPAIEDLNGRGWLLDEDDPRWVIVQQNQQHETVLEGSLAMDETGNISGSIQERLMGYAGLEYRGQLLRDPDAFFQNHLAAYLISGEIDSTHVEGAAIPEEAIRLYASVSTPDFSQKIGDVIYFRPMLHFSAEENPFLSPTRLYPVDFGYPYTRIFLMEIRIPEGFEVEEVPVPVKVKFPDNSVSFEYAAQVNGNQITIRSAFMIQKSSFDPALYKSFKKLYDHMLAKHGEQIAISKKE